MKSNFVVPLREKFAYGMGDFGLMIGYGAIGFYFVFFLTDVAGLPAQWAGYIFLIARAWDALTDYSMGVITDRTRSRIRRGRNISCQAVTSSSAGRPIPRASPR